MASNDGTTQPGPQGDDDDRAAGGPPSIKSSRMTDIISDDGREDDAQNYSSTISWRVDLLSDAVSQPESGRMDFSLSIGPGGVWSQSQPLRTSLSGAKRGSGAASIISSTSGHQASYTSRSHVPSLLSHGFLRPMSSQKLQMLRGGTQSPTVSRSRGPNRRLRIALLRTPAQLEVPITHRVYPKPTELFRKRL